MLVKASPSLRRVTAKGVESQCGHCSALSGTAIWGQPLGILKGSTSFSSENILESSVPRVQRIHMNQRTHTLLSFPWSLSNPALFSCLTVSGVENLSGWDAQGSSRHGQYSVLITVARHGALEAPGSQKHLLLKLQPFQKSSLILKLDS